MAVLAVKVSLICSGKDANGKAFEETTRTTLIEEDGGRFLTKINLAPKSAVSMCLAARKGRVIEAQIEGQVATSSGITEWQFRFASAEPDFWGVRFPSAAAKPAAGSNVSAGSSVAAGSNSGSAAAAPAAAPSPAAIAPRSAQAVVKLNEELILLSQHAEDHMRFCREEISVLRQQFAREIQGSLESATRQLQQLARSTIQTTFRSLLEDLASCAQQTVDENMVRLRKAVEQVNIEQSKYLEDEAETHMVKVKDKMDAQVKALRDEVEDSVRDAAREVLADFQAGCAQLLGTMAKSAESHKAKLGSHRKSSNS